MSLQNDIDSIKILRDRMGYSRFDHAMRAINRERIENPGRDTRKKFPWSKYTRLYKECKGVCWWCESTMPLIKGQVEVDHFDPNEQEFNGDGNLGLLHAKCNREKGPMNLTDQAKYLGITVTDLVGRFRRVQ